MLRFFLLLYGHSDAPTGHVCRSEHEPLNDCKVVIKLNLTFAAPPYALPVVSSWISIMKWNICGRNKPSLLSSRWDWMGF